MTFAPEPLGRSTLPAQHTKGSGDSLVGFAQRSKVPERAALASHQSDDDLPITWPFVFGGLLLSAAMVWFCLGFALRDAATTDAADAAAGELVHHTLAGHYPVFWLLLLGALASCVVGAAFNMSRTRRLTHS